MAIRKIAIEAAALGHLQPNVLAQTLIAEGGDTERGRLLKSLGMPGPARLGVVISQEAKAAGVYGQIEEGGH